MFVKAILYTFMIFQDWQEVQLDLLEIMKKLKGKDVELVSNKESVDTSTPTGKLMLTMIGAINEFERENMLERQREGIAIAKSKEVYNGRLPKQVKNFDVYYEKYLTREIKSKTELSKMLEISRPTLDRLIKERDVKKR